jgi:hypothetical protein
MTFTVTISATSAFVTHTVSPLTYVVALSYTCRKVGLLTAVFEAESKTGTIAGDTAMPVTIPGSESVVAAIAAAVCEATSVSGAVAIVTGLVATVSNTISLAATAA